MSTLVTGAAGFVGSHLVDALRERGANVIGLDDLSTGRRGNLPAGVPCMNWDVRHPIEGIGLETLGEVERIYHLACPASPVWYQADPLRTLETAFLGTRNVFRLAHMLGARVLIASTSEVYGDPTVHPQPEGYRGNTPCYGPRACYDEGKRAAEALAWCYQTKLDVRIVRIFNTYGPRMRPDDGRLISNFIVQALQHRPVTLYGTGDQTRSLCYVSDLVDGLLRAMEAPVLPGPVNLGNPQERTVREIAEAIFRLLGRRPEFEHRPLPADDPGRRCPDITRARALLGFEPRVSLEDGLTRTIAYFAEEASQRELDRVTASR